MGPRQRERAERRREQRPVSRHPSDEGGTQLLRCPRCGSTNLAEGDQAFEGRFVMCGNCDWQGVTKPGVWG